MSVLLPQKDNFSSKFVKFYRKVFPSVDEKYWRIYKSNIYETIKFLSVSELRWEIFKSRAELESKFTFIWSSVIVGVISAGIFAHGLELATQVIALGEAAKNCMITTVYEDFFLMVAFFTFFGSLFGWLVASLMKIPGGSACWFYGILLVMSILLGGIASLKHTIIIDFIFLVLNVLCIAVLLGTIADLKKQKALIKLSIMEDRLKELDKV